MNERPIDAFMDDLNVSRFDAIFSVLYTRILAVLERLLVETKPEVVGCTLLNSTWPGTLFILKQVKELMPQVRLLAAERRWASLGHTTNWDPLKSMTPLNV